MTPRVCRPLPDHFMISQTSDAGLYDTRAPNWMHNPPLRYRYAFHHRDITNAHELKATLRAGATTDLGGYPLFFVTADNDVVSFAGALANLTTELCNQIDRSRSRIVACEVNYENAGLYCNWTGERIPSAYAEDEAPIEDIE